MNAARITASAVALVVSLLGLTGPATAFQMIKSEQTGRVTGGAFASCDDPQGFTHWRDALTSWRHNPALQGAGKTSALQGAMSNWTLVPSASHRLVLSGTTTAGFATDGQNTVSWGTNSGCAGTCLALTALVLEPGQVIVEADITFNNARGWTTDGADFDTQAVATHELGHALGIHHSDVQTAPLPTMHTPYFGATGRRLSPDDQAALQCSQARFPPLLPGPPLTLVPQAGTIETLPGTSVTTAVGIVRGGGFSAPVTFSIQSGPAGVTLGQLPNPAPGASAALVFSLPNSLAIGTHAITVRADGGGESATAVVTLSVKKLIVRIDGDLALAVGGPAQTVGVTLLRAPGFVGPVTLSITGGSSLATLRLQPTTTIGSSSLLTGRPKPVGPGGVFFPTLRATAGSVTHSQLFEVEVVSPFP